MTSSTPSTIQTAGSCCYSARRVPARPGVLAALARDHLNWPRYFIRRAAGRETSYQHEGGLASFLTVVGLQLAARRRDLFPPAQEVTGEARVDVIEPGTELAGIVVPRVIISPFTDLNVVFRLRARRASGEITTVTVGEIVEAAYADPQALEKPALTDPVLSLARQDPGGRIVILLDGIDELRLRDPTADVLTWLTGHTQFPENVRFVVASRPDERLDPLISNDRADVKRVILEDRGDARRFAELIADSEPVSAALASKDVSRDTFISYATRRADGNFRYLALLRGMIEENAADLDWLAKGADRWPDGLNALYRDYLLRTRDRVGRATRTRTAWEYLYRPVLGVLTVAEASLTAAQIEAYGGITAIGGETCATALERLGQLLRRSGDAFRFDHASLTDFLTGSEAGPELRTDPGHWHKAITGYAFGQHAATGNWPSADPYLLVSLPAHAEVAGRLDELIEEPRFLVAADLGDRGILSRLGAADRARPAARLLRLVLPMLRRREPGVLAHLHMYACQAGLDAFAAKVALLISGTPWLLQYGQWRPEQVRGVIGQHDGEIRALAITRDDRGRPVAVTGGADRTIRVWDLMTGTQLAPLRDRLERVDPRPVWALAAAQTEPGRPLVVSGDSYGTVRAWDLTTGTTIGEPMEDFGNCGHAIGSGTIGRSPVVLCRAGQLAAAVGSRRATATDGTFRGRPGLRTQRRGSPRRSAGSGQAQPPRRPERGTRARVLAGRRSAARLPAPPR